jgi:hypothetical protein
MSVDSADGRSIRSRIRALFSGRKGAVLSVALIVWGLTLFDLTLLPRQDTPFLPALGTERLVDVRVVPSATIVTSADPTSPGGPWVLTRQGNNLDVVGTLLPDEHDPRRPTNHIFRPRLRATVPNIEVQTPIAVDGWNKWAPALFTISSARESPTINVYSLQRPGHPLLSSNVPLPPQTTDRRDFFIARWSGLRPDLFVVDRNTGRRKPQSEPSLHPWSISIYSGESGFKRLIERSFIRPKLSRRLSKSNWWLDVAPVRQKKPNLFFITRERRTGSHQTEIHVLSGQSKFHNFSLHAATALPQRLGLARRFVFQPGREGGAVLMVKIEHDKLSIRALPLP